MNYNDVKTVIEKVHFAFVPDLFHGNANNMARKDYIISSYGISVRPMIWVCYHNKSLRGLELILIDSITEYLGHNKRSKYYLKKENVRYLCKQFIHSKEVVLYDKIY